MSKKQKNLIEKPEEQLKLMKLAAGQGYSKAQSHLATFQGNVISEQVEQKSTPIEASSLNAGQGSAPSPIQSGASGWANRAIAAQSTPPFSATSSFRQALPPITTSTFGKSRGVWI